MSARISCCLWMFPISNRDPDCMEKFAYTDTETLLWDYSETEEHYVLVIPPARRVKTLYRVTQVYAYQWFGINGGNNLKIIYYPFAQTHFRNLTNPCDCPPESVEIFASISVSPTSVLEGSGTPMIYTVTLDIASLYDTTVNFTLTGTAVEGVDYTAVTHSVTITAGQTTGTFAIHPIADASAEGNETVIATLIDGTSGVNVVVISTPVATGTIIELVISCDPDPGYATIVNADNASLLNADNNCITAVVVDAVTWDPLSIDNVVLSNGNLTNTNTGIFDDNFDPQGDIVTGVLSSGKYYFEVTYASQNVGFSEMALGIGSAGGNYSGFNYASGAYGAVLFGRFFGIYADSLNSGKSLTGPIDNADGDIFAIAADLDNNKVWFQVVAGPDVDIGNWNGVSGDPVLGTGGIAIPTGLKTIFGTYADGDNTEALTLNLGTSAFSGTAPTGYTPGWPSNVFVPVLVGAPWDPATAINVALSNSDLTATNLVTPPGYPGGSIGTVAAALTQRLYFEVTCTQPSTTGLNTYYLGLSDGVNDIYYGFGKFKASGGMSVDRLGVIWDNGASHGDALNLSIGLQPGDVLGVAYDTLAGPASAWIKLVGGPSYTGGQVWAGKTTSSYPPTFPGTNTWGCDIAGLGDDYPCVAWGDTDLTQSATFNFTGPFLGNPSVTWNPPQSVFGGTAVRSNGNLTVTSTNGNPVGVISNGGHRVAPTFTGQWWFEITLGATYAGTGTACGICNWLGMPGYAVVPGSQGFDTFQVDVAGKFWFNNNGFSGSGATAVTLGATLPGDVLQFAVKIGNTSQIWVRINRGGVAQNWNGDPSATPSSPATGFDITALFNNADVLNSPSVFQGFNSSGSSSTVNFGQSAFASTPSFAAWSNTFTAWGGALDPARTRETTLSNGNLTATNNALPLVPQGVTVAAASGKTSGKYYFEITITIDKDSDAAMGVAVVGTDYLQFDINGTGGVSVTANGDVYANGVFITGALSLGQVDRVGIAVDLDNRKVWVKTVDGSDYYVGSDWNGDSPGTADPATNLNGIDLVAGTIVPIVAFSGFADANDQAGNASTINTGQTPFAGLTPVGFTSGWPE